MFGPKILLLALSLVASTSAFAPAPNLASSSMNTQQMSSSDMAEEGGDDSRRGFITKLVGGAALAGITANGVLVQGPTPFVPSPQSLNKKLIVITGGNTGLGLESGKRLAAAGATVVLTSRNLEKGSRAVQSVKDYVLEETGKAPEGGVYTIPLDLCDLESVKAFPDLLKNSKAFDGTQGVDVLLK